MFLLIHRVKSEDHQALTDIYAFCGDCWCVPESGEACPYDEIPSAEFGDTMIENLRGMKHENPLVLDCDPYSDMECDTVPSLDTGGVCGALIRSNGSDQCPEDFSYL